MKRTTMSWTACFILVYALSHFVGVWAVPIACVIAVAVGFTTARQQRLA
ncbi:hypothetical protein BH11ACT8_BH11ACT8_17090 [soil metagenome]